MLCHVTMCAPPLSVCVCLCGLHDVSLRTARVLSPPTTCRVCNPCMLCVCFTCVDLCSFLVSRVLTHAASPEC